MNKFKSHTRELKYLISFVFIAGFVLFLCCKLKLIVCTLFTSEFIFGGTIISIFIIYYYYGILNFDITLTDKEYVQV